MKGIKQGLFQILKLAMVAPMTVAFLATGCANVDNSSGVTINQTVPPFEIKGAKGSINVGGSQNGVSPTSDSSSQLAPPSIQQTDDGGSIERRGDCFIFRDKYGVPKRYQGCPSDMGVPSPIVPRSGR
jgi:hypothetical protein